MSSSEDFMDILFSFSRKMSETLPILGIRNGNSSEES